MPTETIGNCKVLTKLSGGIPTQHQFTIPLEHEYAFFSGMQDLPNLASKRVTVLGCICGDERNRNV